MVRRADPLRPRPQELPANGAAPEPGLAGAGRAGTAPTDLCVPRRTGGSAGRPPRTSSPYPVRGRRTAPAGVGPTVRKLP